MKLKQADCLLMELLNKDALLEVSVNSYKG